MSSNSVPEEKLTSHSYDGIQEYDNPLPGWWKFLFWVFILFAPVYYAYVHLSVNDRSVFNSYKEKRNDIFRIRYKDIGVLEPTREEVLKYMNLPDWLSVGESVYKARCINCHGKNAEGKLGPNLTDDYWKNVYNVEDIAKVIADGAANGSMPAWKNRLSHPNDIVLTAAYIASLRKKPVAGGRPPEGKEVPPWE